MNNLVYEALRVESKAVGVQVFGSFRKIMMLPPPCFEFEMIHGSASDPLKKSPPSNCQSRNVKCKAQNGHKMWRLWIGKLTRAISKSQLVANSNFVGAASWFFEMTQKVAPLVRLFNGLQPVNKLQLCYLFLFFFLPCLPNCILLPLLYSSFGTASNIDILFEFFLSGMDFEGEGRLKERVKSDKMVTLIFCFIDGDLKEQIIIGLVLLLWANNTTHYLSENKPWILVR